MDLLQFQTESKRTMPFGGEPKNNIEFENMLGNYAMGLVGEFIEMLNAPNEEELAKEIGDVMHYGVGLLTLFDTEIDLNSFDKEVDDLEALTASGEVLELAKKHIYHRHELPKEKIVELVYKTLNFFAPQTDEHWVEFEDVLQMNIDKLMLRYPEKFNTADSIARVDTAS